MELIVTRWIALSGTARAARERAAELRTRFPEAMLRSARAFDAYRDVRKDCEEARKAGAAAVYPLGAQGFFSNLWQMAQAEATGLWVDVRSIPIRQETVEICEYFDMNPYYLHAEGALLLLAGDGGTVADRLRAAGIPAAVVGHTESGKDRILYNQGRRRFLDRPQRDEIYKAEKGRTL